MWEGERPETERGILSVIVYREPPPGLLCNSWAIILSFHENYSRQPEINMVFVISCVYHFLHDNLRSNMLFILFRLSILIEFLFAYSTSLLDTFAKI